MQLALILGMVCSYLAILGFIAHTIGQVKTHPHEPVSGIGDLPNSCVISFWSLMIGLPVIALILGIWGILPGTRRKDRYDNVA